ncbi:hypothetical protein [Campylobacter sp. MG1]|uniref:hypothetical protein n=1 Tax=Campylobacter sp. MG1 TaxID=2976332 RepID=UPI00226D01A4|nr:hypothetical protein [Campylobacter sp. MG1]
MSNNSENGSIIGAILGIGIFVGGGALGHSYFFSSEDIAKLERHISNLQNENRILSKRYSIEKEYYLINSCVDKKTRTSYLYKKEQLEKECFQSLKNIENDIKENNLTTEYTKRYF